MEVERQPLGAGAKRAGPPPAPEQAATEQLAHLELGEGCATFSGSSSDKRQRRQAGQAACNRGGGDDEPTSSLLPIQPLTAEAAERLQRQGSPELEEEDEGAALAAMLAPQPGDSSSGGSTAGEVWDAPFLAQLGSGDGDAAGSSDVDMVDEAGSTVNGSGGSFGAAPGSPQAAAAAAADQRRAGEGPAPPDPVIRRLAQQEEAAPIQMLDLGALSKNPLLQQFQLRQAAERQAEQRARALAAAAVLRQHGGLGREDLEGLAEGVLPPS